MTLRENAPYRWVALIDETGLPLALDPVTAALPVVDFDHHEIHEGDSYYNLDYIDLTNGQVYDIQITTPNSTKRAHLTVRFDSEAEATIIFYEGITSTGGTAMTAFNHERSVVAAATVALAHSPTVSDTGTKIVGWVQGAGKTSGGGSVARNEFVLKTNTKYLLRITNATTSNNWFQWDIDWYEHIPSS